MYNCHIDSILLLFISFVALMLWRTEELLCICWQMGYGCTDGESLQCLLCVLCSHAVADVGPFGLDRFRRENRSSWKGTTNCLNNLAVLEFLQTTHTLRNRLELCEGSDMRSLSWPHWVSTLRFCDFWEPWIFKRSKLLRYCWDTLSCRGQDEQHQKQGPGPEVLEINMIKRFVNIHDQCRSHWKHMEICIEFQAVNWCQLEDGKETKRLRSKVIRGNLCHSAMCHCHLFSSFI